MLWYTCIINLTAFENLLHQPALFIPPFCFYLQTATSGEGVDVVIEMLANVNLQKDLEILAPEGVVAVSTSDFAS